MRVVRKPRIGNRSKVDMLVGTVTGGLILGLDTRAGYGTGYCYWGIGTGILILGARFGIGGWYYY